MYHFHLDVSFEDLFTSFITRLDNVTTHWVFLYH